MKRRKVTRSCPTCGRTTTRRDDTRYVHPDGKVECYGGASRKPLRPTSVAVLPWGKR